MLRSKSESTAILERHKAVKPSLSCYLVKELAMPLHRLSFFSSFVFLQFSKYQVLCNKNRVKVIIF